MSSAKLFIIGGIVLLAAVGAVQFIRTHSTTSPTLPKTIAAPSEQVSAAAEPSIATTTVDITRHPSVDPLPIVAGDAIVSWNFAGVYAHNPELITKAHTEIDHLSSFIGKGIYSDMNLYVGIADQYELLGDRKQEYNYLIRAVKSGGTVSGLPWHNLGVLMERLGALGTARVAYEKATIIQPQSKQWHFSYLEFITTKMKNDVTDIEKAFAAADIYFAHDADMIQLRSEWEKS